MDYKVSIIIPIYGVEPYIERCARSLFQQTLDDIEYIFVNDCTPDKSMEILNDVILDFPSRAPHIKILKHEHNKGLPQARKTGLENATGRFVLHTDSDDWMDSDMCEKLLTKAEQDSCEIVVCDYKKVSSNQTVHVKECFSEDFFVELLKTTITGSLCNKLISRSLFTDNEILFPTHPFCEDYVLTIQTSYYANHIGYVPEALYNYVCNPNSITQAKDLSKIVKRLDDDFANYMLVEEFMERQKIVDRYRDEIIFHKLKMKNHIRNNIQYNPEFLKRWRNTFAELNYQIFTCKYIGIHLLLSYYATYLGVWTGRK